MRVHLAAREGLRAPRLLEEDETVEGVIKQGLSFDDVLLVPKRSIVSSRRDVDTRTKLSRRIGLNVPVVSANMDTVTESAMAIALARLGGIGIIHRFMPIEQQ